MSVDSSVIHNFSFTWQLSPIRWKVPHCCRIDNDDQSLNQNTAWSTRSMVDHAVNTAWSTNINRFIFIYYKTMVDQYLLIYTNNSIDMGLPCCIYNMVDVDIDVDRQILQQCGTFQYAPRNYVIKSTLIVLGSEHQHDN
jgi:hypothetical protein